MLDWIDSPRLRRLERWLWNHPKTSLGIVALFFVFIFFPQWGNAVWYSFYNEPPIPSIAKKMNWQWTLPTFHISASWIVGAVSMVMFVAMFYLLIMGRRIAKTQNSGGLQWSATGTVRTPSEFERALMAERDALKTQLAELEKAPCPDQWLHNIAEYDKSTINKRLRVLECKIWNRLFDQTPPEILFYIHVLNSSVYPIVIEEAANPGRIKHIRKALLYPPAIEDNKWECQHGCSQSFFIRQQLTDGEIERIKSAQQGTFQFDALTIMIKGGKGYEDMVQSQPLVIPYWLGINNDLYPART